jgi:hypothetical protein
MHGVAGWPQTAAHLAGGDNTSFTAYAGLIALFANIIVAGVVHLAMIQQRKVRTARCLSAVQIDVTHYGHRANREMIISA